MATPDVISMAERISARRSKLMNPEDLLSAIVEEIGGTQAYVTMLVKSGVNAQAGSMAYQRFWDMMMRLTLKVYDTNAKRDSVADMTTEELQRVLHTAMNHGKQAPINPGLPNGETKDGPAAS